MVYDEQDVLTVYILRWHYRLMTRFESQGMAAIAFEEKARTLQAENELVAAEFRKCWSRFTTRAGRKALKLGSIAFHRQVCLRILRDHGREIVVNRCPKCQCVARTPKAKQCFWCGHDWHFTSSERPSEGSIKMR
ncbi:MAG: hypothetical protein ABI353_22145 [Isosphaeraceae bacterium]